MQTAVILMSAIFLIPLFAIIGCLAYLELSKSTTKKVCVEDEILEQMKNFRDW